MSAPRQSPPTRRPLPAEIVAAARRHRIDPEAVAAHLRADHKWQPKMATVAAYCLATGECDLLQGAR